jgi:cold shock CspA family protein
MFDWMNPNKNKQADTEEKSNDFFGNMFKINSTPEKQKEVDEASHHARETHHATTEDATEIAVINPLEIEKKKDFVAEAFNNLELGEDVKEEKSKEIVVEVREKIPANAPKPAATATQEVESKPAAMEGILADGKAIHHGRVRWFYRGKGFGFISPVDENGDYLYPKSDDNRDIFVHQSDIHTGEIECLRYLYNRERVDFKAITDKMGRIKATEVTGPDGKPPKCAQQKLKLDKEQK